MGLSNHHRGLGVPGLEMRSTGINWEDSDMYNGQYSERLIVETNYIFKSQSAVQKTTENAVSLNITIIYVVLQT